MSLAARSRQLWRYYGVGLINTAFGFGMFAGLVRLGLNIFAAQILAQIAGASFNYVMFRWLVFNGSKPAIVRYIGAYTLNYLIGLGSLAAIRLVVRSPYLAGFFTLLCASAINYLVLKFFVFRSKTTAA